MEITKIVITGGPCAGKSKVLKRIHSEFTEKGYTVLTIAETATELINGGVSPATCASMAEFQILLLILQLQKETAFEKAAKGMGKNNILIVCDRGALDNKAYLTQKEFQDALKTADTTEFELCMRYDGVFHLMTTAKGLESEYSRDSNSARTETPMEALLLDDRLLDAWALHPYRKVISNHPDFNCKANKLIDEIDIFLKNSCDTTTHKTNKT